MKNFYPELKFYENRELDYWTAKEFSASLANNPSKEYIDTYYADHDKEIKATLEKTLAEWDTISNEFYQDIDQIFDSHLWPKGEYVGFASIFDCNPRFLGNKTFQFFYNHPEGAIYVAAHEMLHFMFFNYAFKHFPELTEDNLWDVSEIFNVIILSQPEFVAITGNNSPRAYPEHQKEIPKYTDLWKNSKNVTEFIKSSLDLQ
ncbi:MAG: hypothetical protein NT141_00035 [candidate division WWE3 bacterium]|nr:hypothetical protein [candidate division WWE3 bacterium]